MRSATVLDAEDSVKAPSSMLQCWKMLVSVSEGTGAALCVVALCSAAPGRVSSDDVQTDVSITGGLMFTGVMSDVTSNKSVLCRATLCKSQGMAAEVESEVMGDGDMTFLVASAAGGMSGRVSLTMFAGVGADGSSAPSQSRFLAGYMGTGMEAAVVCRNSASTSLRILTWALREARVSSVTGCEQHAA